MLIKTVCQHCGVEFEAASFAARYHSTQCKQAAYRARRRAAHDEAGASRERVTRDRELLVGGGFVEAATLSELQTIRRERSAVGLAALALARRIDAGDEDSAGGLAAIVREHARALERALMVAGTPSAPQSGPSGGQRDADDDDPVIRLQEARDRRRRRHEAQR